MFLSKNLVLRLEKTIILQPRVRYITVHTQLKKKSSPKELLSQVQEKTNMGIKTNTKKELELKIQ